MEEIDCKRKFFSMFNLMNKNKHINNFRKTSYF